eukprot:390216-Prymnesium_polylepis.1
MNGNLFTFETSPPRTRRCAHGARRRRGGTSSRRARRSWGLRCRRETGDTRRSILQASISR